MAEFFIAATLILLFLFAGVVFVGAPYVPSLRLQIETALDLLDLKPGEVFIEVGSGDGRVLLAAAQRGWYVIGYEINPVLVLISKWRLRKHKTAQVQWRNAWRTAWPAAKGVYVFGLQSVLPKVHKKIIESNSKDVALVSVGFPLDGVVPKQELQGVFLYCIRS